MTAGEVYTWLIDARADAPDAAASSHGLVDLGRMGLNEAAVCVAFSDINWRAL